MKPKSQLEPKEGLLLKRKKASFRGGCNQKNSKKKVKGSKSGMVQPKVKSGKKNDFWNAVLKMEKMGTQTNGAQILPLRRESQTKVTQ